ncbi:conserved Plasmodium protein, unknown function [Plasmodium relictum]|uniref:CPW-WPC domain-containing protein n=1 Tax=Plasmodium relictum TaxID=85471 RepID=A0A1J1H7G9_PLARL|nr:conserved Plasmodium protein, unknown function [Plasmodium relictum]CRH00895.1 conserved Plasmodium protein, unknown function [Plasmodium relictum]
MNEIYLFIFVLFFHFSEFNQMAIIKDMSKELKNISESLPTQKDINNKIHKIDNEVLEKLNEDIINDENLAKHKPHVCQEPPYERDYSYLCPEGWIKNSTGQCWGIDYDGHCESLKYFQEYSDDEKLEFELNCCALWPKLKNVAKKTNKKDILRGSINSNNGLIIKPKNM